MQHNNTLPPGYRLQEYHIESVLGSGGFGVTYKARDSYLDVWVAIKEYFPPAWSYRAPDGETICMIVDSQRAAERPGYDFDWGLRRFLDEVRTLARVRHPRVVGVRRYFRANGTAYIVMDYEEGEPLDALLHRVGVLDEVRVRSLLADILPALHTVHRNGVLHRDIKPANLYRRTRDGRVMLMDFGSARELQTPVTAELTCLITPGYSPPEQYTAHSALYGTWSDIYSLGAVLYRCVTGQPPQPSSERLLNDTLVPAVDRAAGRYSRQLLEAIDRCLALRPDDRFRSVAELSTTLERPAVPVPVAARAGLDGGRWGRARGAAALAAVAVLAGLGGGYAVWPEGDVQTAQGPRYVIGPQGQVQPQQPAPAPGPVVAARVRPESSPAAFARAMEAREAAARPAPVRQPLERPRPPEPDPAVRQLLARAEASLADYRLTTPERHNAWYYYRQVLALDAGNAAARRGLAEVATRYVWLAEQHYRQGHYDKARLYVERGLGVAPGHARLSGLKARLDRGRERRPGGLLDYLRGLASRDAPPRVDFRNVDSR